jgi:predicted amino acid dehydrogenase
MSTTHISLAVALTLGIVLAFGGFTAFAVVALSGVIGFIIGRVLEGKLDLQAMLGRASDRR